MLRVGILGLGFMGWIHWLAYKRLAGIEVVAICEQDPTRRTGDWRSIRGNFGPPGEQVDLSRIRVCTEIDELLTVGDLDVVDICLPPSLHCAAALRAFDAGLHVFCEKPLSLDLDDCDRIVSRGRQAKKQLLVGHVLPFFPEYAFALDAVRSGKYGGLLGGSFKRVISDPAWLKDFYNSKKIGGPLLDLHVHDAHFIRLLFGMPTGAYSVGRIRGDVVSFCQSVLEFSDPALCVTCTSGVIDQQARPFNHAFEIHLERATLQFEFAAFADNPEMMPLKVLTGDGKVIRPTFQNSDSIASFVAEIEEVRNCLQDNRPSEVLGGDLARDAIAICQMQRGAVMQRFAGTRNTADECR